jgi:mono/diheme cytochrome c family protein
MRRLIFLLPCAFLFACDSARGGGMPEDPAVKRGRQVYVGTCIACHNMNPAMPGGVGPEIKGSPRVLLEAKLLRGEYPAGYKPKRETRLMPPQPQLEASIADLAAFLK